MILFKKLFPLAALTMLVFPFGVQPLSADTLALSIANSGISGYTGPFGNVTITLEADTHFADITFTAFNSPVGGFHFLMGGDGAMGLNVNSSAFDVVSGLNGITSPKGPQQGATGPDFIQIASGNEDGFGSFNLSIKNFDGFSYAVQTASFTLQNTAGTWSSAANVLTANATGYEAAAHIYVANPDWSNTNSTGYSANGASVPDGGTTALLLGLALAAGNFTFRRKK
jgi:hypothetical protein